jgi:PKD repeat protein
MKILLTQALPLLAALLLSFSSYAQYDFSIQGVTVTVDPADQMSFEFEVTVAGSDAASVYYNWDFGDGNSSQGGSLVHHTYSATGTYFGSITVMSIDLTQSETVNFTVNVVNNWQGNPPEDVNNDGLITPLDALLVINEVNRRAAFNLPAGPLPPVGGQPYDVNGDNQITAADVMQIIQWLNANGPGPVPGAPIPPAPIKRPVQGQLASTGPEDDWSPMASKINMYWSDGQICNGTIDCTVDMLVGYHSVDWVLEDSVSGINHTVYSQYFYVEPFSFYLNPWMNMQEDTSDCTSFDFEGDCSYYVSDTGISLDLTYEWYVDGGQVGTGQNTSYSSSDSSYFGMCLRVIGEALGVVDSSEYCEGAYPYCEEYYYYEEEYEEYYDSSYYKHGLSPGAQAYTMEVIENPVREQLRIAVQLEANTGYTVEVLDATGRKWASHEGWASGTKEEMQVPLAHLPSGIYFVQMKSEAIVQTARILVMRQ